MLDDVYRPAPLPWWYPSRRRIAVVAAFVVVAVLAVIGVVALIPDRGQCAEGVVRMPDQECVGVTDGSYVFAPPLADVERKVLAENRRVDALGTEDVVSIAFLVPIPRQDGDQMDTFLHELQGAHLGQLRANHSNAIGDTPLIRLLIVNVGERGNGWRQAVAQVLTKVGPPHNLMAVTGLGESRETSQLAAKMLAERQIPMIASMITADDFAALKDGSQIQGFSRVTPTNTGEVQAAVTFLQPEHKKAVLIQDTNETDLFVTTLGTAFVNAFWPDGPPGDQIERYDPRLRGVANTFDLMMPNLCQKSPDVVYFAGRTNDLQAFIEALPERRCTDKPIKIMTGDDATSLPSAIRRQQAEGRHDLENGLKSKVTLWYTALAHPDAWQAQPEVFGTAISQFRESCETCYGRVFPGGRLEDGQAIMAHDSIVVAVRAIRRTQGATSPAEVVQTLYRLHGELAVPCASGVVELNEKGDPQDKPVPVLEIRPDGTVEFKRLVTPSGRPPLPPGS